ncbi:MAG: hypothetical protein ACT4NL_00025 [Pseudomarimonas sp.]
MPTNDKPELSMLDWTLEPKHGEMPVGPVTGKAKFNTDARSKEERRKNKAAIGSVPAAKERRVKKDRRPVAKGWESGKNL